MGYAHVSWGITRLVRIRVRMTLRIPLRSADLLDGASVLLLTPETIAGVLIALVIAAALSAIVAAREAVRVGADEILRKV